MGEGGGSWWVKEAKEGGDVGGWQEEKEEEEVERRIEQQLGLASLRVTWLMLEIIFPLMKGGPLP